MKGLTQRLIQSEESQWPKIHLINKTNLSSNINNFSGIIETCIQNWFSCRNKAARIKNFVKVGLNG